MIGILWDLKRQYQLDMMRQPLHSGARVIYRQLIAEIDERLATGMAGAQ